MPVSTTWRTSLTVLDPGTSLHTVVAAPSRILFKKTVLHKARSSCSPSSSSCSYSIIIILLLLLLLLLKVWRWFAVMCFVYVRLKYLVHLGVGKTGERLACQMGEFAIQSTLISAWNRLRVRHWVILSYGLWRDWRSLLNCKLKGCS